jgi:hypothetical protein
LGRAMRILEGTAGATKRILALKFRLHAAKERSVDRSFARQLFETDCGLVGCEGSRKAVLRSGVIEMKQVGGALEQIGGEVAGLVIDPAGRVDQRNFLPQGIYFHGAETVQHLLDLIQTTFRKQKKEIVIADACGNVGAAACLFQVAGELLKRRVHGGLAVSCADMGELVHMNSGEAQGRVLAACPSDLSSEMLLEGVTRAQAGDGIDAGPLRKLLGQRLRVEKLSREMFSQPAEGPLAINQPGIENKQQTERGPARLIRADFVEMIRITKERANRGEQKSYRRKCCDG